MALPSTGLTLEMIRLELGLAAPTSLGACLASAGKVRPGSMSDFAGYSAADTQAPTVPGSFRTGLIGPNAVDLMWAASSDNVGVSGYNIQWKAISASVWSQKTAGPSDTTTAVTGLSASTTYDFRMRAYDAAGNYSAFTATISATTSSNGTLGF